MAFNENELDHNLNHLIVCNNGPILCTYVYLVMANNVSKGSFHFPCTKKSIIHFPIAKKGLFEKQVPIMCCQNEAPHFNK